MAEDDEEVGVIPVNDVVVLQLGQVWELRHEQDLYLFSLSRSHRPVGVIVGSSEHSRVGKTGELLDLLADRTVGSLESDGHSVVGLVEEPVMTGGEGDPRMTVPGHHHPPLPGDQVQGGDLPPALPQAVGGTGPCWFWSVLLTPVTSPTRHHRQVPVTPHPCLPALEGAEPRHVEVPGAGFGAGEALDTAGVQETGRHLPGAVEVLTALRTLHGRPVVGWSSPGPQPTLLTVQACHQHQGEQE